MRGLGLNADAPAVRTEDVAARRAATEIARATLVASCAETAAHSDDVDVIAEGLCRHMGLVGPEREDVLAAARLHDIGKIAIPSEILHKPETLDDGEWSVIHRHTEVGASIIAAVPELASVATLVRHSHERWDGRGYPDGLAGEEIPLGSRIVFCADAFHAIRSDRPYRPGRPAGAALREIHTHAGTYFDPDVVGALRSLATETRLVTSRNGLTRRSSRLVALLMILTCGVGGSALARSGVIGTPSAVGPAPAPAQAAAGGPAAAPFGQPTLLSPAGAMCARDACEPRLLTVPLSAVGLGVKQGSVAPVGVARARQEAGLTGSAEGAGASGDGRDPGALQPGDASAGAGGTAPAEAEGPAPSGGKSGDLSGTKGSGSQSSPAPGGTSGSDSPSSGGKTATESKGTAGSTQTAPAPTSPPDTTVTVPKTSTPTKSSTPLPPAPPSSEPAPAPSGGKAPAEGKGA